MLNLKGHTGAVRSVCYAADGRLASGGDDGTVRLWEPSTGTLVGTLMKAEVGIEALSFQPDGKRLVAGLADGSLVLRGGPRWTARAREQLHEGGVRALAHAADGRLLSCGWDGCLLLWEAGVLAGPAELLKNPMPLTALAVSADGKVVAAAVSGQRVDLFDLTTRKLLASLGTGPAVFALAFSPDGHWLASAADTGEVCLWRLGTRDKPRPLPGHTWTVYGLAFTPDGQTLISGGADGTVRLWDVGSGRERDCYRWFSRWVTCLAVSPDGHTAAAGSDDHNLVIWDL
jgi:WD40 repeat protein